MNGGNDVAAKSLHIFPNEKLPWLMDALVMKIQEAWSTEQRYLMWPVTGIDAAGRPIKRQSKNFD
ncbi:MAG: hypothetical protein ACUVS3_10250 [Thermodesulfobacteriota bacterium]